MSGREELVSTESTPTSGVVERGGQVLIPNMTPEEVAQSAISRGKKLIPLTPPDFCTTREFRQIIAATFMIYMKNKYSVAPSPKQVAEALEAEESLSEKKVTKVMKSPQFRTAMDLRGVEFGETRTISPEQDMAIAIMAAPDGRPFEKKLKAAGVAPSKWRAWMKNKVFQEAWIAAGGSVLKDHEQDMLVALAGQALRGDVSAIKYALEVSGRHAPMRQQNIDATVFVAQILDIIQEEVRDAATLERIGARMQMLGSTPNARSVIEQAGIEQAPPDELEG